MKKISIIIPTYNSDKVLENCIDSLLKQTYSNLEIIVVDDGSTDQTEQLLKNYNLKYKSLIYIKQNNSGVSNARNTGIKMATGDYIFFIDSDDTIDSNVIEKLVLCKKNNVLISVNHCIYNENTKKKYVYEKKYYTREELVKNILNGKILGVVWGYLFDADIIKKMKFDEKTFYLEDTLFLIEYLNNSNPEKIIYIDENCYYNYLVNNNSITSSKKNILKKCKNFCYSLDKINLITELQYNDLIQNNKISLLEKEMRLCDSILEYKQICKEIKISKYTGKELQVRLFTKLFKKRNLIGLKIYYFFRNIIKKILMKGG